MHLWDVHCLRQVSLRSCSERGIERDLFGGIRCSPPSGEFLTPEAAGTILRPKSSRRRQTYYGAMAPLSLSEIQARTYWWCNRPGWAPNASPRSHAGAFYATFHWTLVRLPTSYTA